MLNVSDFWSNIDRLNPYDSLKELCLRAGIHYKNTCQQRADGYMPKPEALLGLSKALSVSINGLLTGREERKYSAEIEEIARWLSMFGTEEDLAIIRRLLRIPPKNNTVSNKQTVG